MSLPQLRQPKFLKTLPDVVQKPRDFILNPLNQEFVIVTLLNDKKLVLSSDALNGLIKETEMFKCVFCGIDIRLDDGTKEVHITSLSHRQAMANKSYVAEFSENLVRWLNKDNVYCSICNVIVSTPILPRHTSSDVHQLEMEKAEARADIYKPLDT